MPEQLEWVARISNSGRFYYLRVPDVYGKRYHRSKVKVTIEILEPVRGYRL